MQEFTMGQEIFGIVVLAIVVGFFIIRNEKAGGKKYVLRGKMMTLKQIAQLLCVDGVFICEHNDRVQMAYDHDVDSIPAVLQILADAGMPGRIFNETSVLVMDPVIYREVS